MNLTDNCECYQKEYFKMEDKEFFNHLKHGGFYFCSCDKGKKHKKAVKRIADCISESVITKVGLSSDEKRELRYSLSLSVAFALLNPYDLFTENDPEERLRIRDIILKKVYMINEDEREFFQNNLELLDTLLFSDDEVVDMFFGDESGFAAWMRGRTSSNDKAISNDTEINSQELDNEEYYMDIAEEITL
jgi:hypothetical protein